MANYKNINSTLGVLMNKNECYVNEKEADVLVKNIVTNIVSIENDLNDISSYLKKAVYKKVVSHEKFSNFLKCSKDSVHEAKKLSSFAMMFDFKYNDTKKVCRINELYSKINDLEKRIENIE